ncbi:hypothetical protein LRR80_02608 [Streptomyces sp. RO-S4]|uniref:hypothetical protein n=1 Tax=unclassified Streptomyces TaxID=2593676 RepID=UPI001E2EE9B9|nr:MULTISPECIES: hypothetical protein [unclassified Streptomyces]MCO4696549.1 hypothetical protein [Streptomyces sp. RO-S4]
MITHADEDPEFEPDDPLAVLLRPTSDHLGPPPGRFETIRRRAARRRLVRTAVGAGVTCAVALLVALPLQDAATSDRPVTPTVPLAPPVTTTPSPTTGPTVSPRPAESPVDDRPGASTPQTRATEPRARGLVVPTPARPVVSDTAPEDRRGR